ncbi:AraC family transcriptional regulator [bacterium]|nr:AraC family transcriptional regulator [bacterium]
MYSQNKLCILPELGGLQLQKVTYKTISFAPHFHEEYGLGVFLKGSQAKFYRRSKHVLSQGSICVLNPGEMHHACSIDQNGWTYRMLYIDAAMVKQVSGTQSGYPFFPDLVINDPELFQMIVNLHLILEQPEFDLLLKESKFIDVLEQLILRYADEPPRDYPLISSSKHIKMVKEHLDEYYNQNISLKTLSTLTELSPFYLLRLFKKEVGTTPHVYLTQRRIIKAKQLLTAGDSLCEVANKTGFVDQSHFTHRFRDIVGVTPGQYNPHIL